MARVLLGVTGGIAAYKACTLIRLLVRAGHDVYPLVTAGAERFVSTETFLRSRASHRLATCTRISSARTFSSSRH